MPTVVCPGCSRRLTIPDTPSGKDFRCPACGSVQVLPENRMPPDPDATVSPSGPRSGAGPRDDLAPPGYEIISELGRGGMGVVYKARQHKLERVVALKMILAGAHAGEDERARFQTEAQAVARLQHPGIVTVYEIGEHHGQPFLALEFCPGGSLEAKLADGRLKPDEAAALVQALALAVQAAHDAAVIHRDLKPANVMLGGGGAPKVTDFGLAKKLDEQGHTQTGAVMGTPAYFAPEQAAGKKAISPAADVYSLGAILYECLTGRPPFRGATVFETIAQVLSEEPRPPRQRNRRVPRDLETICLKCLNKEPGKRYASARELGDDLGRFLAGEPIQARAPGALGRLRRWAGRRQGLLLKLATTLLSSLLIGLVVFAFSGGRGKTPAGPTVETDEQIAATVRGLIPAAASMTIEDAHQLGRGEPVGGIDAYQNQSLSLYLLVTPLRRQGDEGEVMGDEFVPDPKFEPRGLAEALSRSRAKGYATLIQPEFITDFTCRVNGGVAAGTVWFRAEGLYSGRAPYSARRVDGRWRVEEFRVESRRARIRRHEDGNWRVQPLR